MTKGEQWHDLEPGKVDRCQITGSANLFEVIDLGHQAPCDSMLTVWQLDQPEKTYPLRLNICPGSGLAQLDYVVDGREVYHPDYPYRSGVTKHLAEYQRAFADGVVEHFGLVKDSFIVDIGSNDGTLLTGFQRHGMRVLGIEPTNIAGIALQENNVPTAQAFFTERLANVIVKDHGKAKIITATNVFAHMALLGEVCRGIEALLDEDGVFITESHYLLDVLNKNQFDTIYHEHIRTYSLKSLVKLFPYYNLEVFDVERADRYGGNIRAYIGRAGKRPIASDVTDLLRHEDDVGLHRIDTWVRWRDRVDSNRDKFMSFMWKAKSEGRSIAGNSCPGRCATLLNYYGVTKDLMPYICELPNSLKLNLYLPGAHIPVVGGDWLVREQPDYVLLNAWHYAEPISRRLRSEGVKSKLVMALPEFTILDV